MSDNIEKVKVSNQLRNLRKLCENLGVKFFVAFEENVHGSTTKSHCEGNLSSKAISRILAGKESPQDPITDLPKLPINYEALFKASNQQTMLNHANLLMKKYVGTTPIGLGKQYFNNTQVQWW